MGKIEVVKADITTLAVDAIVNAANTTLLGGGGVDGAIHRAAGPELLAECRHLGGCKTGQAKLTKGYKLPARHVIHTVGPVWQGGEDDEPELLANCYRSCFELAHKHNLRTLAFPAISCGVYGFPVELAVKIAMRETLEELMSDEAIEKVGSFASMMWSTPLTSGLKPITREWSRGTRVICVTRESRRVVATRSNYARNQTTLPNCNEQAYRNAR
jgi:O-acetyl-ADP-ribose deacetylase